MAAGGHLPTTPPAGEIMTLPSGGLRVRVYAGIDPLTGKKHHLTEVIPGTQRSSRNGAPDTTAPLGR